MTLDERIARINELARKAKTQGLTETETRERDELRTRFLQEYRRGLEQTLEHTYIVDAQGNKRKLQKKNRPSR